MRRGHAMGLLRLAILGSPEIFHDGRSCTFAVRKGQALLLYRAVEGGMHPRSKLAALLWPDSTPHDARTALRNALTLLRSLLADPTTSASAHLLSEGELLGLDPQAPLELDLAVGQQAYTQTQRFSTPPAPPDRSTPPCGRGWPRTCASSPRRRPSPWRNRFAPAPRPAAGGAPLPVPRPGRAGRLVNWWLRWWAGQPLSASSSRTFSRRG